jgi:hypothetical protein
MAVTITWSLTNGGSTISSTVDHGNFSNGGQTTAQEIYVRHDGVNPITSCGFFIQAASDSYEGGFTASQDLDEVISWGNGTVAATFGGFQFNLNATGIYPSASWPTVTVKAPIAAGNTVGNVCRTGVGDSATNNIGVVTQMGCTSNGTIQTGSAPGVRFQCRFSAPSNEDTVGIRHVKQSLTYVYTS